MKQIRSKSLKEKRSGKELPAKLEQEITDLELESIVQEQTITDMELDILELQQSIQNKH